MVRQTLTIPFEKPARAAIVAALFALILLLQPWAQPAAGAQDALFVSPAVKPHVAKSPEPLPSGAGPLGPAPSYPEGEPLPAQPPLPAKPVSDGVTQTGEAALFEVAPPDALSAPDVNAAGVTANANPPDTVLDVGPNHIVQMTNNTGYIVFDKQGNPIGGATPNAAIRNLAALYPAGDNCNFFDTDPIVVYDHLADRWLMAWENRAGINPANPGAPLALCIVVSQTPDPTGAWFAYTFDNTVGLNVFPDYEKIGVWMDGYYMSSYEGSNLGVFVFDRAAMLAGAAAGFMKTTISSLTPSAGIRDTRILPADLDGPPPPVGTPNFFVRTVDDQQDTANPTDRIEVYEAVTDWVTPSFNFNLVDTLTPAAFNVMACNRNGGGSRDCIPEPDQPAANTTIDALSNRPMMQLKFREFGSHFSMVFNQAIDVGGSLGNSIPFAPVNEVAGTRWYELRKSGANWVIHQQGTYAPQPIGATMETQLLHRWMGSTAMDKFGNIALGYSIVNDDNTSPVFPSIAYTGRRADDVLGLMTQTEQFILNGVNSQNGVGARWGDYSAMTVDPVDDCTFWYTQHVAAGAGGRPTQIASFRFDNCALDLSIAKTASPDPAIAGEQVTYTVTVANNGPLDATNVTVIDTLPVGVTFIGNTDSCVEGPVGTLTCSLGNIPSGGASSFNITAQIAADLVANAGGPISITNTATVSADQQDSDLSNNQASATVLVEDLADLRISKDCKPDTPLSAGATATCTILVDNLGPSDARDVVVTDTHVSNGSFTITSATFTPPGAPCAIAGGTVTCTLGTEPAGGRTTIVVELTSNEQVDVNDTATVTSTTPDPDATNNSATDGVSFRGAADLSISKTDTPDPVVAGTSLTYNLTVMNNGPSTAPNVVVRDTLPAQVSDVSFTPSQGSCSGGIPGNPLQPLTCNLGALANGAMATIVVVVRVSPSTPDGTILINNAFVSSDHQDPDNGNNTTSAPTTVQARADLAIGKTSDADTYKPSSLITYTVTVVNDGPSDALAVVVTDNLPTVHQAIYLSDTGGCTKSGDTLTCNLGDMPVGTSKSFNIDITVKGARGDVSNTASVTSSTVDPDLSDNSSTRVVTVQGGK